MPNQINSPETSGSVDRLTLATESARGAVPSVPGICCAPCACAEVDCNE